MYLKGSFAYPYLEDSDPWNHAVGVKYVAVEKTAYVHQYLNNETRAMFRYMGSYPPAYDVVMSIFYQTTDEMIWTLKFFNALIISLGIIFFYFFVGKLTNNKTRALYSTFVLTMIPCYLSHFIWAHSLIVTLIFPLFYSLEMIRKDKKWSIAAMLIVASILVIQPSQAFKIGILFFLYFIARSVIERRFLKYEFLSGLFGLLLASIIWWVPALFRIGYEKIFYRFGLYKGEQALKGTADRVYSFSDFFVAKAQNMINNPIGVGVIICLLLTLALTFAIIRYKGLLSRRNQWLMVALLWLVFTFLGIHGARLPISLFSFRFWMLFAIPASILAGYGIEILMAFGRSIEWAFRFKYAIRFLLLVLLIFTVWKTSGYQKYAVNTSPYWDAGSFFRDPGVLYDDFWLRDNTPKGTKAFTFPAFGTDVIAFDRCSCEWCTEVVEFRKELENKTVDEFHSWLRANDYEYTIISSYYHSKYYGENKTVEVINEMVESGLFIPVFQPEIEGQKSASILFEVV